MLVAQAKDTMSAADNSATVPLLVESPSRTAIASKTGNDDEPLQTDSTITEKQEAADAGACGSGHVANGEQPAIKAKLDAKKTNSNATSALRGNSGTAAAMRKRATPDLGIAGKHVESAGNQHLKSREPEVALMKGNVESMKETKKEKTIDKAVTKEHETALALSLRLFYRILTPAVCLY